MELVAFTWEEVIESLWPRNTNNLELGFDWDILPPKAALYGNVQDATVSLRLRMTEPFKSTPILVNHDVHIHLVPRWRRTLITNFYEYLDDESSTDIDMDESSEGGDVGLVASYQQKDFQEFPPSSNASQRTCFQFQVTIADFQISGAEMNMEYVVAASARFDGINHDFILPPFAVAFDPWSNYPKVMVADHRKGPGVL